MTTIAHERISPEEYLQRERLAETKSEYDDGVVRAMSGASEAHNLIVAGIIGSAARRLPSRCLIYPSDMRVRIQRPTRFFYPDATIVCGERQFDDQRKDVLLNPVVVFEVLSPTTETHDRGRKLTSYKTIGSLQEIVLVSQDRYQADHYRRDGKYWRHVVLRGPDAMLQLLAGDCDVPLRELYYRVDLRSAAD